jgi:hypothetical protein
VALKDEYAQAILRAMKSLLAALLILSVMPAAASAADIQTCRSQAATSDAPGYERVGREVRRAIVPETRRYLGFAQYTAYWLQPDDAGWYVGVAPGKRSLAQVRRWLRTRVNAHFHGEEARLIRSRMHVIRQPYGLKELIHVGNDVWDILRKDGPPTWTGDDACTLSDAYRSEVTIYNDSPPEAANRVRRQLAKFGDRVRVTYVDRPLEG